MTLITFLKIDNTNPNIHSDPSVKSDLQFAMFLKNLFSEEVFFLLDTFDITQPALLIMYANNSAKEPTLNGRYLRRMVGQISVVGGYQISPSLITPCSAVEVFYASL